jgi:class 3 adenylate cyclase/predicted ATPase
MPAAAPVILTTWRACSLPEGRDIEAMHDETAARRRRCIEIIEQHHGFVAGHAGHVLLAYFGHPEAREDDCENSVRTALLLQNVSALGADNGTRSRPCIGMATGIVVIGDEFAGAQPVVSGDTLLLAERLQAFAEPGQIVIAQSTRRLAGGVFEYEALGPVAIKGLAAPMEVSLVVGESGVESRFEAHHPQPLTPLLGRGEEVERVLRRWQQAKAGEGAVVLLAGEPGIGKSRIADAIMQSLSGETYRTLRVFCSPHRQDSALSPFVFHLERAADFRRTDTAEEHFIKLQRLLDTAAGTFSATVSSLADLLAVSIPAHAPQPPREPQQRKEAMLKALLSYIEGISASGPLLMIVEDIHWADPTSIELIDLVVERVPHLPLLLVVTYRPEFVAPWIDRSQTTLISLGRLPPRICEQVVTAVARGRNLPRALVDQIIDRTDGVPLFIEELTKAVVESDAAADSEDGVTGVSALDIPMTLHASLLARLDRLGQARETAQVGAALGRRFSHELISAVAAMPQSDLHDALGQLVGAGLIWRRGTPPDAEYTFKHALIQDAAYNTLLREPCRAVHSRIAEVLESQFPDIADGQPELLAHHYTEAGRIDRAADLWGKAGQLSLARSAMKEAVAQLTRALHQTETLPDTAARRAKQIKLQLALANALMHARGYAAPETNSALDQVRALVERAQALGEPFEDPLLLFSVLHGFWVANHVAFNRDAIRSLSVQFLALANKQRSSFPLVLGHRLMGTTLLYLGDIEGGRNHLDEAIAHYDPDAHRPLASRLGQDGGVAILSNRLLALWLLGYPDAALKDADDALRYAREIGQAGTYLYALTRVASFNLVSGNYEAAAEQARELITIAEEIDGSYWKAAGTMTQSCLLALTGKPAMAIPMIMAGMAASRTTGARLRAPWYWSCLARAHAALGKLPDAWRCIDEAMTAVETTGENWQESDLHRIAGDLALMAPSSDAQKAEAHFARALAVAREQQAKSWELRAAIQLARMWRDQGEWQRACAILAPIYAWFTEGFGTYDLKEAKALLSAV